MERPYHIVEKKGGPKDSGELSRFLTRHGQALLPLVELIEQ